MKKNILLLAVVAFSLQGIASLVVSGRSSGTASPPVVASDTAKQDTTATDTVKKVKKKKEPTAYERLIKNGGSVNEGLFTVRHIKDDWYFEIPDSLLNRLLLVVTRFTGVPQNFKALSGEEASQSVVYFEAYNEKTLFLRAYVKSQLSPEGDNITKALKHSTVDPIIQRFDVIGRNPSNGNRLVNVTRFFLGENAVTSVPQSDRSAAGLGGPMSDRSFIDSIKTYPINVEVQTLRTYSAGAAKNRAARMGAMTLNMNTSMVLLPKTPMRPRLEDERVGYFVNGITEFSDKQQTVQRDAIISRYRLEPKDPVAYRNGKLTEPKKPIIYYIDPATPKKWVKYLIAGVNDWNKAFEAAGFKNAIMAKEWPNDPSMSLDDARFSVIRYLPSETENAYGPRIVDPRSGEIIDSHIGWYHNVMNLVKKWYMVQCGPLDAGARKMNFDDELMGQLIRFVSSHEVGHTLGLRHNMIASSATPVEKLRDKRWVEEHGHTASIMDYARFNYVAQPEDGISHKGLFPRINDYDKWAIKWGYQYRPEFKDEQAEKKALRKEVTKALAENARLVYIGDEGRGPDPRSQSEDLGDNSMKASDYGIKNLHRVIAGIEKWTAQPDGQYDDLTEIYKAVRGQYVRYAGHVMKNVGGRYINSRPGLKPYDYVPRERQKEAIDWIGRQIFTAPLWLYPESILSKTGVDAEDEIVSRQNSSLSFLLAPTVLYNIQKANTASSAYPLDEYLNDVFATVWKPLNNSDERQNNYRRQLERSYVAALDKLLNPLSDPATAKLASTGGSLFALRSDVVLYLESHLDKVEQFVKERSSQWGEGTMNRRHYDNLLLQIKKVRDKYTGKDK